MYLGKNINKMDFIIKYGFGNLISAIEYLLSYFSIDIKTFTFIKIAFFFQDNISNLSLTENNFYIFFRIFYFIKLIDMKMLRQWSIVAILTSIVNKNHCKIKSLLRNENLPSGYINMKHLITEDRTILEYLEAYT